VEFSGNGGIFVRTADLWLDALIARPLSFVSHAHSDHVRAHTALIATPATCDLVAARFRQRSRAQPLEFGKPLVRKGVRLTLYPAGHVLGSAQALLDDGCTRLLYSGDVRLRPSLACEAAEVPGADILIMESTFGRPRWVFPPQEQIDAAILHFVERAFADNETPVLFAYSLGKAQEAVALLHRHGVAVAAQETVREVNAIYQRHGVALPDCLPYEPPLPARTALVCPPQSRRAAKFATLGRTRTAILSGWALESSARFRYSCDEGFPLSDHCGYDDLLRYVELTGAREVYTVHGYTREFAEDLQRRGVNAFPLVGEMQLALPGLLG
jgi:Cft2 family RNA processing exonuclease